MNEIVHHILMSALCFLARLNKVQKELLLSRRHVSLSVSTFWMLKVKDLLTSTSPQPIDRLS